MKLRPGSIGTEADGDSAATHELPVVVDGRYQVRALLGRGGMALVFDVDDLRDGRRVALKRMLPHHDELKRRRSVELFEREYHTLSQLKHPRIVRVHDYSLDRRGEIELPFYTMELLDGGDLQELAPSDWKRACAIARDMCSALSLLHSRRFVHRDLTTRNVRCTSDGLAKLIDFGAMAPMGPSKYVVGTPTYCAPEIVNLQAMDERTDLYSLGATLYYTLTGRHAYPSTDFATLPQRWALPIAPPSELAAGIPEALDRLVLDLLALDPAARPSNAAEVIARLSAITAGAGLEEQTSAGEKLVAQAYLATPSLVGRAAQLSSARRKLMRGARKRGSSLLIGGESGMGRSRLLDACALEAKLLGTLVLRADADDALDSDYGGVRALARQLIAVTPDNAFAAAKPKIALLVEAVPELREYFPGIERVRLEGAALRTAIQAALREWLFAIARVRPLLIAIDDLHRLDEPSAALIALLAHDLRRHAVTVIATVQTGAAATAPAVLKLLSETGGEIALSSLSADESESLLRSLFGDAPSLPLVAHRLHALSAGNPRDLMQLAQRLVDLRVARYEAGAWSLPSQLDASVLPSSMAEALKQRLSRLSSGALELSAALALCPEQSVSFDECLGLCETAQASELLSRLDELITANVFRTVGERYLLASQSLPKVLLARLPAERIRVLHLRLSALFSARDPSELRVGQHLLAAGEIDRALDALIAHAHASTARTDQRPEAFTELVRSLPEGWSETLRQAIALCTERGRSKLELYAIAGRYAGVSSVVGAVDRESVAMLVRCFTHDAGLDLLPSVDPQLPPLQRVARALELGKQRSEALPPHERGHDPVTALRQLGRVALQATGTSSNHFDVPLLELLPSLEPLAVLSPALGVADALRRAVQLRLTGQTERSKLQYAELLESSDRPDRAGMGASHYTFMRVGLAYAIGVIDAALGFPSALDFAEGIEQEPTHRADALYIRMLYRLWQGDVRAAERDQREGELQAIQGGERRWYAGTYLFWQLLAYAGLDDLTRVKRTCEQIEPHARVHRGWQPIWHFGLAEYHRIRGDAPAAWKALQAARAAMEPSGHQIAPYLGAAEVRVLAELGQLNEALAHGRALLAADEQAVARGAGFGFPVQALRSQLALVEAQLGDAAAAVLHAEQALSGIQALGASGIMLALAHEARARVALWLQDGAGFERHVQSCAVVMRDAMSSAWVAKLERLRKDGRRAEAAHGIAAAPVLHDSTTMTSSQMMTMMDACEDASARSQCALTMLMHASGAQQGLLYLMGREGPVEAARSGDAAHETDLQRLVDELVREAHEADGMATSLAPEASPSQVEWTSERGEHYRPVVLSHDHAGGFALTGVALLSISAGASFQYPAVMATELSRLLLEAGDAVPPAAA